MVGMRERAELIGSELTFSQPAAGGTLVKLRVPRPTVTEAHAQAEQVG